MSVLIAFLSLAVEAKLGYPDRLFRAIGHPVTWIGRLISCLDRMLNRATDSDRTRRLCGVAALVVDRRRAGDRSPMRSSGCCCCMRWASSW